MIVHHNFDLRITGGADGGYRVEVVNSPAGEASGVFSNPFDTFEIENLALHVNSLRRRGSDARRRIETPSDRRAREVGIRLFDAVFTGAVGERWAVTLNRAEATDAKVRLRIRLDDAPDLHDVPWEFLYSTARNGYLVHDPSTSLTRYVSVNRSRKPLTISGRLRVLVIIANPSDLDESERLDTEREWDHLSQAVSGNANIELVRLPSATLTDIGSAMRYEGPFHGVHFVGHGVFDPTHQDSLVVLESSNGKAEMRTGTEFATVLAQDRSLRFVFLNSCEGARTAREDPFAGAAHSLIATAGLPAVVAMQFTITDAAAAEFARGFYTGLAAGATIDDAVADGRIRIFTSGLHPEWGTPVLYMRSDDGHLFEVHDVTVDPEVVELNPLAPAEPAPAAEPTGSDGGSDREGDASWPELTALVDRYNVTRQTRPGGADRTMEQEEIVDEMQELLREAAADRFAPDEHLGSTDRGRRIAGYAFVLANPDPLLLTAVAEATVREDKPFGQYTGLRALERLAEVAPLAFDSDADEALAELRPRLHASSDRMALLDRASSLVEEARDVAERRRGSGESDSPRPDPEESSATRAAALAAFQRGVAAAEAMPPRYQAALNAFDEALELEPGFAEAAERRASLEASWHSGRGGVSADTERVHETVRRAAEASLHSSATPPLATFTTRPSLFARVASWVFAAFWASLAISLIGVAFDSTNRSPGGALSGSVFFFLVAVATARSARLAVEVGTSHVRVLNPVRTIVVPRDNVAGVRRPGWLGRWVLHTKDGRRIRLPTVKNLDRVQEILGPV